MIGALTRVEAAEPPSGCSMMNCCEPWNLAKRQISRGEASALLPVSRANCPVNHRGPVESGSSCSTIRQPSNRWRTSERRLSNSRGSPAMPMVDCFSRARLLRAECRGAFPREAVNRSLTTTRNRRWWRVICLTNWQIVSIARSRPSRAPSGRRSPPTSITCVGKRPHNTLMRLERVRAPCMMD